MHDTPRLLSVVALALIACGGPARGEPQPPQQDADSPSLTATQPPADLPTRSPSPAATPPPSDQAATVPMPQPATHFDSRLQMHGSITVRSEQDMSGANNLITSRFRYKAYNSWTYRASDQYTFGMRLRSGNPFKPNSASQTINLNEITGFQVDQAYVDYQPRHLRQWDFLLGSFQDPYRFSPVYNQMVWSPDNLNVGGFAARYRAPGGRFWGMVSYGFDMPSDTGGWGGVTDTQIQAGWVLRQGPQHTLEFSAGMQWMGFSPAGLLALLGRNRGNAVQTFTTFTVSGSGKQEKVTKHVATVGLVSAYDIFNPRLDYYFKAGRKGIPMVASIEYFDNMGSSLPTVPVNGKTGYGLGIKAGQVRWPGTIELRLEYLNLGQDSVMSMFNQSDFPRAVNCDGLYFSIRQPVTRNLSVSWILNQVDQSRSTLPVDRGRVDFMYTW